MDGGGANSATVAGANPEPGPRQEEQSRVLGPLSVLAPSNEGDSTGCYETMPLTSSGVTVSTKRSGRLSLKRMDVLQLLRIGLRGKRPE